MKKITVNANAKINLFLEVNERLSNGYHDLQSIMQAVSLCDVLHIEVDESGDFKLDCPKIECDLKDNLIYKAAMAFYSHSGIPFTGLDVKVEKNIPACAGLAGGSTDAAAILKGLNVLYDTPFSNAELRNIGKTIGADVPFCIMGGTAVAKGIGEILTPVSGIPDCYIVISIGNSGVSTKWAFEQLDSIENRAISSVESITASIEKSSLGDICRDLYNVFESVSPYDTEIKDIMKNCGALGTLMSGSGPSVFSVFDNKQLAENTVNALNEKGYSAFLCTPQNNI
ncbi:MAG: 4-(cytidine 5'-diphospho)-2-C-methyl-D-erythritol kinase [Clostridia bacterium]|nr:4-(cytidine 5'-diphospho)-2-C-methyl-D-erythritol kinase [Clostridia bacterium]